MTVAGDQTIGLDPSSAAWIDTDQALAELIDHLLTQPRYALDTEFHRERTFYPKLALMQFASTERLALVDPLAVDVTALQPLFASDVLAVLHAAQQDIDVLTHAVHAVPERLYDTQLSAGFIGYGSPSLAVLVGGELGIKLAKGDRLTDWLQRPLTDDQCEYAAVDVAYLLELHDRLDEAARARGRTLWIEEACEELRTRPPSGTEPDQAWLRLKDARSLRPRSRATAKAVAAWRERRAMALDVPVRQVLPDLALLGIALRQPRTARELTSARGVESRYLRDGVTDELLALVEEARTAEAPEAPKSSSDLDRTLRPAVALVTAWISQVARDEALDTALLATRADINALLAGQPDARLAQGWRAELVGEAIKRLVAGEAGLTFDPTGGLRLIDV